MEEEKTDVPTPVAEPSIDLAFFDALLSAGAQRARLLVNGVAGPLTERQRSLAMDLADDLEQALEALGPVTPRRVQVKTFDLCSMVAEVVGTFRFVAHRKQLALMLVGAHMRLLCVADPSIVVKALTAALGAAMAVAPSGARVTVEVSSVASQLMVDVEAPGWDPRLPPLAPVGSGLGTSVIHTANGARLRFSLPAVL